MTKKVRPLLSAEANIKDDESIIMIGHSAGGVAVIDAYDSMTTEYKERVTQVVAIGSPKMPIKSGKHKTTVIKDPNDAIPKFGTSPGRSTAKYLSLVDNGVAKPELTGEELKDKVKYAAAYVQYAAKDVHIGYFNDKDKSANILNQFWDRAVK